MKRYNSYYWRLTCISVAAILALALVLIFAGLTALREAQKKKFLEGADTVLRELEEHCDAIWDNYYKGFIPLKDDFYLSSLKYFCLMDDEKYNAYTAEDRIGQVMRAISRKDEQIDAICIRRMKDEMHYLFYCDTQRMERKQPISDGKENSVETGEYRRTIIGGRKIKSSMAQKVGNYWGIQSGIMDKGISGLENAYQITMLYSLDDFDEIIAKYHFSDEVRFLILAENLSTIYDSCKEYSENQDTYLDAASLIAGQYEETILLDGEKYLKKVRENREDYKICYLIPQKQLIKMRLDATGILILLFAVCILIFAIIVSLSVNRMIYQRFVELEKGICKIGNNHLNYRIPVPSREDEFSRIAMQFNTMCDELEELINKNYIYRLLQQKAEMTALQNTVNPHFLYNSLEAIRSRLHEDGKEDDAEMVLLLARIYEYQIRGTRVVSLKQEKRALQNYLEFSSIRYQYSFEYILDFQDEILDCVVPKQILQPVLENYFVHGFRGDGRDRICVKGKLCDEDGMVHIFFEDNGKGMDVLEAKKYNEFINNSEAEGSHIGLYNVSKRLKIAFGEESHVIIAPNETGEGVCVILVFKGAAELHI